MDGPGGLFRRSESKQIYSSLYYARKSLQGLVVSWDTQFMVGMNRESGEKMAGLRLNWTSKNGQ